MNTSFIIKTLRQAGLTQTEISKRTGIPQPRLSRWEHSGTAVGDDALALTRLAQELDQAAADKDNAQAA
jgi:transcriptional regulator with XRE-family HTH domain